MRRTAPGLALVAMALLLGACTTRVSGTYPAAGSVIPTGTLQLTETSALSFSSMAHAAALATGAYYLLDPLAPNWEIEETRLGSSQYRLSMRLKRFTAGGTGEARQALLRRASQLARDGGYAGFQVISFTEGVDFGYPVSQRVSEGVIQLVSNAN